jgi:nucleotide-binding universal stress UspA family protein
MTTPSGFIAVGVNGTAASDAAVRYAAARARHAGVGLRLIHALPEYLPASRPFSISVGDLAPTGRTLLRDASRIARAEWAEVPLDLKLVTGPWVKALLHASAGGATIVLGCEQRSTLQRLATGTTVIGVAARAPVPVIAVAPTMLRPDQGRITVGIKHATESSALLRASFEEARDRDSELYVVHAWVMPPGYQDLLAVPSIRAEIVEAESDSLAEVVESVAERFPEVKTTLEVVESNPARALQSASEVSDLLLLARRRHAFPRGHVGGTARALLHHSSCPVAILPPADEPAHLVATDPDQ